nr:RNA polymerase beta subunit [Avicennia marina]
MLGDANEAMSTIPGFNQIQFEGFCRFIDQGLAEELYKFPKIEDTDHEIEFQLFVERYQLVEPLIKEKNAVYESLTYSSELYVSAGLIWKTSRDMQEQTILIGNIPLMNSLGTSIVNGIYRIVINQILQTPGIYYRSELDHNGISAYTGTIISDWGGRSELEIDRKARIWARVSRKQKISILVLSSAMGSNLREILDNVYYPEIFCLFGMIRREKKLDQKKMPFWSFINNLLAKAGIRYFLNPYVRNYKRSSFNKDVNKEGLVDEIRTEDRTLIYPRTIHFWYHETYWQPLTIGLDLNLEEVHLTVGIIGKISAFALKQIFYKINSDCLWFVKKMWFEELYVGQFGINRYRLLRIWKLQLHKQPPMNLFLVYTPYLKFKIELIRRHKKFMGESRVIKVLEDKQGEQLVFGYEISILVTMVVFAQLTRLRESMLDLLDPKQFMQGWVIGDLKKVHFMKFRRDQQGYDCFIYHQVEMNTICKRQEILWPRIRIFRKNRLFKLDTVKNSKLLHGNGFIFEVFFPSNTFLLELPSFLLLNIMMRIGLKRVLICNVRQFRLLGPRNALLELGWNDKQLWIQGLLLKPNVGERSFIKILTRSFSQGMEILKVFPYLCINVPTKILVCIKNPGFSGVNALKRDKFKQMVLLRLVANFLWGKTYKKLICHGKVTILKMQYSLVSVWYTKIFILLFTYGTMRFRLMGQAKVLKGSLTKYHIEKPIYFAIETKMELWCWDLGWRRVIFEEVNERPKWGKNRRMPPKIDCYEPYSAFRYLLQKKLVENYPKVVGAGLLMGGGSRKGEVPVIIPKRFVYIFHRNVKSKKAIKKLEDTEIRVSFQKFCLDKICLICKMEDLLIWSSTHEEYLHEGMLDRYLNVHSGEQGFCETDIIEERLLMRDMNKKLPENEYFLNYMKPVSKQRIRGYLNPNIQEKAEYLMEGRETLLNNPLKKESLISRNKFIKLMIKSMDVPVDIMRLLHNNPLGEGQNRGDNEKEKWRFGPKKDLVLLIFYKRCLLINLIILERAKKYLVLRSLEEQYPILKMLQNRFGYSFENYDLKLWNRIISLYLRKTSRLIGRKL